MNVGQMLGLDEGGELLAQVRDRWPVWTVTEDRLAVVDDFDDLRGWLDAATPEEKDEVLLTLAMLAAPDGGDDVTAAAALAKCLLPGACRLAAELVSHRRRWMPERLEGASELVASQLWVEVRSFRWRRCRKVASNVLWNTRAGVLRSVGDPVQVDRSDRTWARTSVIDGNLLATALETTSGAGDESVGADRSVKQQRVWSWPDLTTSLPGQQEQSARDELLEVLAWALREDIITSADRYLLLSLVEESGAIDVRRVGRGYGGLLANEVLKRVAPRTGLSPSTVRRRTVKSVAALAAASRKFGDE